MKTMEHIYFVNAHPDDLCAVMGTAVKLSRKKNCRLHVVDLTHGERSLVGKIAPEERKKFPELETEKIVDRINNCYDKELERRELFKWFADKAKMAEMEFELNRELLETRIMYSTYSLPDELSAYN